MNWSIIIIGNLIMDIAIGLFAIFSGLESRLHARATMIEQEEQLRRDAEMHNEGRERRGPHYLNDEDMKAIRLHTKADRISPITGNNIYYFLVLFAIGSTLQVIGLIINDIVIDC